MTGVAREIVARVDHLPPMPATAVRLSALLTDPEVDLKDVVEVIMYDPGFTTDLLRLANSAYFGFVRQIYSVQEAVVRLGLSRVFQLVVASAVRSALVKEVPGYQLPAGELWRHSVAVALAAEELALRLGARGDSLLFTGALLHDVGKIVLAEVSADRFAAVEELSQRERIPFEAAERRVLGTDHCEIGEVLVETWKLPPVMAPLLRWHHDPDGAPGPDRLIDLVHVADMLCLMSGIGTGIDGLRYQPSRGACSRLGLKVGDLEYVASRTIDRIADYDEMFTADQEDD